MGDATAAGCVFCERKFTKGVLYADDDVIAIENGRNAGTAHWLLMPTKHIRDIEGLGESDIPMLLKLRDLKQSLLATHYPSLPPSSIHVGYHRGRRPGPLRIPYPDIVSVHHLHLHVIVCPRWWMKVWKYPDWFEGMWVSDEWVLRKVGVEVEGED